MSSPSNTDTNPDNNLSEGLPIQPPEQNIIQGVCVKCGGILTYPGMPLIAFNHPHVTMIMIYHDHYVECPKCQTIHTIGMIKPPSLMIGFIPQDKQNYPPENKIDQHVVLPFDALGNRKKIWET